LDEEKRGEIKNGTLLFNFKHLRNMASGRNRSCEWLGLLKKDNPTGFSDLSLFLSETREDFSLHATIMKISLANT
jgi:hypothetical protein